MSTLSSAAISPDVEFELSAGGSVVCVDFHSIAGMMDVILGFAPVRLDTLLRVLQGSDFLLEARAVIRAAVACRDPLAQRHELFTWSLRTMTDLERLARSRLAWRDPERFLGRSVHACALLNACDRELEHTTDEPKRAGLKAIRERLAAAAKLERRRRGEEMRIRATLRSALCPDLWAVLEAWLEQGGPSVS